MIVAREMPPTRRARIYRKLLTVLWIGSISGMTLAISDFASKWMDAGFNPLRLDWKVPALTCLLLTGWGVICWVAYRGSRRNLMPPTWAIGIVVGLSWAAILLNRLG